MVENSIIEKQEYNIIDAFKILLSVLIIQIHSDFYASWMKPYVRLAVPIFFIISSYFFFRRKPIIEDLWNYVMRLLKLYLFWFVFFGWFFLYKNRDCFNDGLGDGLLFCLKSFVFGSTFDASWYIMASIIGTILVFFLSKMLSRNILLVLSFVIYSIITLSNSYYNLFPSTFGHVDDIYNQLTMTHLSVSFPASILWIMMGKYAAESKCLNTTPSQRRLAVYIFINITSLLLLELEYHYSVLYYLTDDCFFFLIPASFFLFLVVKSISLNIPYSKQLRKISTIVYCSHYNIISIVGVLFYLNTNGGALSSLEKFIVGVVGGGVVSGSILLLENYKSLSFLRYSH